MPNRAKQRPMPFTEHARTRPKRKIKRDPLSLAPSHLQGINTPSTLLSSSLLFLPFFPPSAHFALQPGPSVLSLRFLPLGSFTELFFGPTPPPPVCFSFLYFLLLSCFLLLTFLLLLYLLPPVSSSSCIFSLLDFLPPVLPSASLL